MRIEYFDKGPDRLGRRKFFLYWATDYTPGMPYPHERAQVFFADPAYYLKKYPELSEEHAPEPIGAGGKP